MCVKIYPTEYQESVWYCMTVVKIKKSVKIWVLEKQLQLASS